jgi:hypothetical protein
VTSQGQTLSVQGVTVRFGAVTARRRVPTLSTRRQAIVRSGATAARVQASTPPGWLSSESRCANSAHHDSGHYQPVPACLGWDFGSAGADRDVNARATDARSATRRNYWRRYGYGRSSDQHCQPESVAQTR